MIYRLYTEQNLADTSRDKDDIIIEELGYYEDCDMALRKAENFINDNFFHKDTKMKLKRTGYYTATDFCSYGKTINLIPIEIIKKHGENQ